ncbi:MAG: biotin--[acetyl-CoA-carboxylase] ligase [Syntrophomonadaceae bacterium]|nr:biotin--[acetyl-CoA-carboxylase] ligase [Syntrophomonadaceae bacterium]
MRRQILMELCRHPGNFVSGKQISESLGVSRVAVWKHIEALKAEGYDIQGVTGRGYKIAELHNIIIPEDVEKNLSTRIIGRELYVFKEVDSTNQVARKLLRDNRAGEGAVIVAGRQTGGRGRRGRSWESPVGGLWFSLISRPGLALSETALLSLVFAVAVSRALEKFVAQPVLLKWPNDIYISGKKAVGILLEMSGELDKAEYLITGIGINVNLPVSSLGSAGELATSLQEESGQPLEMSRVLAEVLNFLEKYYLFFLEHGFSSILNEFKARCWHLGQDIKVEANNRVLQGRNIDIDESGSLLLDTGDKMERLTTGDVALIKRGGV